ncbi:hypothetical protein N6H05_01325 [Sphingobium sp. WTD-1]|jgi:hypothetical protein|uniref:hypothetical protein n=1 Tax=Sphingobium sp. WTD-1 TaxID=2979467 RepID=UPI0024DECA0A|nr:hypothetical protein [Sphingobium sp. WTD-1]WIA56496.1 hypothetical protein N6H05_01325 [Sphingobium sp. WTD-1]
MSLHFWVGSGGVLVVAAVTGLGLGAYVISPQKPVQIAVDTELDSMDMAVPQTLSEGDRGPAFISCTGCGPTLEERRMQADMAGLDADGMIGESHDPAVRDYLAEEDQPVESAALGDPPLPQPTVQVDRLPPRIERFAAGEAEPRPAWMPVAATTAPPPSVPAEPAEAGLPQ